MNKYNPKEKIKLLPFQHEFMQMLKRSPRDKLKTRVLTVSNGGPDWFYERFSKPGPKPIFKIYEQDYNIKPLFEVQS